MRCWQQLNSHQLHLFMEKTYDICQIVWETVTKVQVNAYFHWWLCGQWMVYVQWKHETHMGGSICIIFMGDPPRFMVYMENPMENPNPKWMMNKGTPWRRKPPVMPDPPSHHWISQNRATGPLGSFSAQPCWLMRWKLGASSPGIAGHWSLELLDEFHITKKKSQWSSKKNESLLQASVWMASFESHQT